MAFLFSDNSQVSTLARRPRLILPNETSFNMFRHSWPEECLIDWCIEHMWDGKAQGGEPGGLFVDIGAHVGTYTLSMALKHPTCQILAFEPQKEQFACLAMNVLAHGLGSRVDVHPVALGSAREDKTLTITSEDGGSTSFIRIPALTPMRTQRASVHRLDDYHLTDVRLIKIDVEGWELEVLKGAEDTLNRCRPKILLEAWTDEWYRTQRESLIDWLQLRRYQVRSITGFSHMLACDPLPPVSL